MSLIKHFKGLFGNSEWIDDFTPDEDSLSNNSQVYTQASDMLKQHFDNLQKASIEKASERLKERFAKNQSQSYDKASELLKKRFGDSNGDVPENSSKDVKGTSPSRPVSPLENPNSKRKRLDRQIETIPENTNGIRASPSPQEPSNSLRDETAQLFELIDRHSKTSSMPKQAVSTFDKKLSGQNTNGRPTKKPVNPTRQPNSIKTADNSSPRSAQIGIHDQSAPPDQQQTSTGSHENHSNSHHLESSAKNGHLKKPITANHDILGSKAAGEGMEITPEGYLGIIEKGAPHWNLWRKKNPRIRPNLRGLNFQNANLAFYILDGADMTGCNMRNANLWHARLVQANLSSADLRGADLSEANFDNANLTFANLLQTRMNTSLLGKTSFNNANLDNAVTDTKVN